MQHEASLRKVGIVDDDTFVVGRYWWWPENNMLDYKLQWSLHLQLTIHRGVPLATTPGSTAPYNAVGMGPTLTTHSRNPFSRPFNLLLDIDAWSHSESEAMGPITIVIRATTNLLAAEEDAPLPRPVWLRLLRRRRRGLLCPGASHLSP